MKTPTIKLNLTETEAWKVCQVLANDRLIWSKCECDEDVGHECRQCAKVRSWNFEQHSARVERLTNLYFNKRKV